MSRFLSGSPVDPPGARESNAGDEFHVLWGVSRCLRMVRPDSPLQRVLIENVSPIDRRGSSGREFLAADVTEYYGGEHFEGATKVVLSQLKYSHRNPDKHWTAARLAPKGVACEKTILGKLAGAYQGYCKRYSRNDVLGKLKIRIVSNRPGNLTLLRLLKECQTLLELRQGQTLNRTILRNLDGPLQRNYELLFKRSGLKQREFNDFLRVLDLDYLASADRFEQRHRIVKTLGEHVLGDAVGAYRSLFELVRKEALPEGSGSPGIGQSDVFAHLGVTGWTDLLPLPSHMQTPLFPVPQPDAERLAEIVVGEAAQRVVAHGDAGVGKTTTLLQLENAMPGNSVVLPFDCFAGGRYRDPTERRHIPRYALRQLINEIALKFGTPLLLTDNADELALWRKLEQVLGTAAVSFGEGDGHLVLAVDAADNAVIASQERQGEPCFVPDLWKLVLPANVHIVMTCRTAQSGYIAAPDSAYEMELTGFDETASAAHLRRYFPESTSTECAQFHLNSNGNPRVQSYVLDPGRRDRPETPGECVHQAATTIGALFDDLLETAIHSRFDAGASDEWLSVLMSLNRPIRMESVAMVLDVDEEEVRRFCRGLVPGVRIENDSFSFRDEDFESHVRAQCTERELVGAHSRIADCYLALKDDFDWAAEAVAGHLFNAGRSEQLIKLTLEDREPAAIADPLARNQEYLRRISLALQMTASSDRTDSLKLIALSAAMKRADSAVADLIRNKPELAMRHADPIAVARVYEADRGDAWKGPLHMRVASNSARRGDLDTARTQLELGQAWIRRWSNLDDHNRSEWEFNADDIAAAAEASFYLSGPDAAANAVRRWHPASFALSVGDLLVERLARGPSQVDLAGHIEDQQFPAKVEARFLAVLHRNGGSIPRSQLERLCGQLIEQAPLELSDRDEAWTADLVEQVASVVDSAVLLEFIAVLRPGSPDRGTHLDMNTWETCLRFACVEAVVSETDFNAENILPRRLSTVAIAEADQGTAYQLNNERKALLKLLTEASDLYLLRAASALGRIEAEEVVDRSLRILCPFVDAPWRYNGNEWGQRFYRTAEVVFESLCLANADIASPCEVLLATTLDDEAPIGCWLAIADGILRHGTPNDWALRLIDRAVQVTNDLDEPQQVQAERLLRCAALVDPSDHVLAGDYYSAAIEASSGLDEEGSRMLHLMNHLANALPEQDLCEASVLGLRLRKAVEHFRPFVYEANALPWEETLATITLLSPRAGLQTLTLWDETGDFSLERGAVPVAKALANQGTVEIVEVVQLLWLTDESASCLQTALAILDRAKEEGRIDREALCVAIAWLGERIARHLTLETRLSEASIFAAWIKTHGFEGVAWASEILAIEKMSQGLPTGTPESMGSRFRDDGSVQDRDARIEGLLACVSSDGPQDLEGRLEQFGAEWASTSQVVRYLSEFGSRISPDRRISALEAITQLEPDSQAWKRNSYAIVEGLVRWTSAWRTARSVHEWLSQQLPGFFSERFLSIVGHDYPEGSGLSAFLSIETLNDPAHLVLETTSRNLQRLTPEQIILIARTLSDHLPRQNRLADLTWLLDYLIGDTDQRTKDTVESGVESLLPDLSWSLLGHPDKAVRWRASHFVLDTSRRSEDFIDGLMQNFYDRTGLGHYAPTSVFLWMSAQVWTLLALRRIAIEDPGAVSRFTPILREVAVSKEWPHALLREIARLALQELASANIISTTAGNEALSFANQPTACQLERTNQVTPAGQPSDNLRFRFDHLDAVPYWFSPVGRIFGVSTTEVETRAERWVVDQLGYDNEIVRADRPQLRDRYHHRYFDKNHGLQPRVEDLRTHLQWHAMFLVAGELGDSGVGIVVSDYDPPDDPWIEWLSRFLNPIAGKWISDFRDPVPPRTWLHSLRPSLTMWRDISDSDFDREVFAEDSLIVSASIQTSAESLSEAVNVSSALVAPGSAESLIASPKDTPTHRDGLPFEDDHSSEIGEPGFQLFGWLTDTSRSSYGLDEHDPVRRIGLHTILPGREFQSVLQRTDSAIQRQTNTHMLLGPASTDRWSDEPFFWSAYSRPQYTSGYQTLVRTRELITFLSSIGKDLILEVTVRRDLASRIDRLEEEQDECYHQRKVRIYLVRRDGNVSDIVGRHFLLRTSD